MKKVLKSQEPLKLKEYLANNQNNTWENFKDDCQEEYKEMIEQIKHDQGELCCYCELNFSDEFNIRDDFRVEHFHPKSDRDETKNWDLEWNNLLGCCNGGSEKRIIDKESRFIEDKSHRHSDILKGDFVWDDEILNPLDVPAFPPIFGVGSKGEMSPIRENCSDELFIKANNSLDEKKLNLNSPILKAWRKKVIDNLRESLNSLFTASGDMEYAINEIVSSQLSKDSKGNHPKFFSTIRSYFKDDAENYLRSVAYEG